LFDIHRILVANPPQSEEEEEEDAPCEGGAASA
jgi:hypothetical protein